MSVSQPLAAVAQNEKVFPILKQRLASRDIDQYLVTTDKLKNWLKSERVYYPAARLTIVELLETAYANFADVLRHREAASHTARSLRELVNVVIPHAHHFIEGPLQARLSHVVHETENILKDSSFIDSPERTVQTSSSNSVRDSTGMTTVPETILSPAELQTPSFSCAELSETEIKPAIASSSLSTIKRELEAPQIPPISRATPPQDVPTTTAHPTPSSHSEQLFSPSASYAHTGSSSAGSSPGPLNLPKPQPKRMRKPELSKLIARDLDWYRSKTTVSDPGKQSLPAVNLPTQVPIETVAVDTQPITADFGVVQQSHPARHEAPTEPTTMKVELTTAGPGVIQESFQDQHLPSQAPVESMMMDVESTVTDVEDVLTTGHLTTQVPEESIPMDVDILPQEHPRSDVPTVSDNKQPSFEVASDAKTVTSLDDTHDSITVNMNSLVPSPPPEGSRADPVTGAEDKTAFPGDGAKSLSSSSPLPPSPSTPPPLESFRGGGGDETDTLILLSESHQDRVTIDAGVNDLLPASAVSSTLPLPPPMSTSPIVVSPQDTSIVVPTDFPDSITSQIGEFLQHQDSPVISEVSEAAKFEQMVVLHLIRGLPLPHTHDINFTLTETMYSNVLRWVYRQTTPGELSGSVCVSLACYRLLDLYGAFRLAPESEDPSVASLTSRASCSWPESGWLSLRAKRDEKDCTIPLSPPFIVTPENCVDISSYIRLGDNSLQIVQYGDLSDYAFVLHAHHPTKAQLRDLSKIHTANEQWESFLESLSSPVTLEPLWENALVLPTLHKGNVGLV